MADLKTLEPSKVEAYGRENRETINLLYSTGIINDDLIKGALEESIIKQAKKNFNYLVENGNKRGVYADHLAGDEKYLAYALKKGAFAHSDISRIPLDHGQNIFEYVEEFGRENPVLKLKDELLNPKQRKYIDIDSRII